MIVEAIYQDGVLKPVKALDLPDNAHVLVHIIPVAAQKAQSESRFQEALMSLGLLRGVKPTSQIQESDRTPIRVKGKPLSASIIEERR